MKIGKDIRVGLQIHPVKSNDLTTPSGGDQYFVDLAWMGLHNTEIYKSKSQTDKIRIEQRINSEVFGKMGAISLKSCD